MRVQEAGNQWIRTGKTIGDSGDNPHPNDAGHKGMGEAVDRALFT